jgi:hypothetical protein
MTSRRSLHDNDFYAWSLEQAALLRVGRVGEADLATIAAEIESMGKWERQPAGRSKSWRLSIASARGEITDLLNDNPSLKPIADDVTASAYRYARRKAAIETDMAVEAFSAQCPWHFARAMEESFWPGG